MLFKHKTSVGVDNCQYQELQTLINLHSWMIVALACPREHARVLYVADNHRVREAAEIRFQKRGGNYMNLTGITAGANWLRLPVVNVFTTDTLTGDGGVGASPPAVVRKQTGNPVLVLRKGQSLCVPGRVMGCQAASHARRFQMLPSSKPLCHIRQKRPSFELMNHLFLADVLAGDRRIY